MSLARYHLLSLAVAVLALLLGLGLGAGPVAQDAADASAARTTRLQDRAERLHGAVTGLADQGALDAAALRALGERVTAGRLDGRSVLVVATPGARPVDVRRVRVALEDAGATVTGVLSLTRTYVDPARAQSPLEDLSLRLVPPGVTFADGSTAIERVGTVLARATVGRPGDEAADEAAGDAAGVVPADDVDQDAAEVLAGLDELDALRFDGNPGRRAELAVVVSGRERPAAQPAVTGLLAALHAGSRGAVLAGARRAGSGPLRWLRDADPGVLDGVSTVDSVEGRAGTVALVLALDEQSRGDSGDYGLGRGARRVLPALPPPPADG